MRKQESGYFLLEIKTQELVGDAMVNKDYPRLQFVSQNLLTTSTVFLFNVFYL